MVPGTHGTTYGGNPLAMAVGNAVLDVVLEEGFLIGLLTGIKCAKSNADLVMAMRNEHLLAVPAGDNVVRLLPPLIVSVEEVREALHKIEAALEMLSSKSS
jgi:acetylornithine/N-succinyldiaminopimelate aminotransferase